MIKKTFLTFIISILIVSIMPKELFAQTKDVKVTLPSFSVSFNGVQVDNTYRQYPLIVYNGITYFPMTYHDSRFLGLETEWDSKKGFAIRQTGISAAYREVRGNRKNGKTLTATVPTFGIQVNGKAVHHESEKYPFLVFRGVTYFPLTWKWAAKEFGWAYQFDPKKGLMIRSSNPQLIKTALPGYTEGQVIAVGGNVYYRGANGAIFQAPMDRPNQGKKVYQLPIWSYGDGTTYVPSQLTKENGEAWLIYHQGGAVMGSDHYVKLKPDGTYEEAASGYLTLKTFGGLTVKVDQSVPPSPGNLFVKNDGQPYRPAGDPAYLYGWRWETTESSSGGAASRDLHVADNRIYLLAFHMEKDKDASRIHKVDLETNETTRMSDRKTKSFVAEGDFIYFASEGQIYKIPLSGGKEERVTTAGTVSENFPVQVLNGRVYYVNSQNHELYAADSDVSLNPGGKVTGMKVEENYLLCTFAQGSPYRIMIFDQNGKVVFKTSEDAASMSIENGKLIFTENTGNSIYITDLRK